MIIDTVQYKHCEVWSTTNN